MTPRLLLAACVVCLGLPLSSGFVGAPPSALPRWGRGVAAASRAMPAPFLSPAMTLAGSEVEADRSVVRRVALEQQGELLEVIEAVKRLEKASKKEKDEADNSRMLQKLTGKWRLVCTTGDKSGRAITGGKLSYFPVKAVQEFDCDTKFIANGVYLGPLSLVFSGELELLPKMRRLEFFFNQVSLGPINIPVDMGRDAKVKPSFSWIDVTDEYALARGAGGGFGLWRKVDEI